MKKIIKRVFVASASDTTEERKRVNTVVNEVNEALSNVSPIQFEVVKWESSAFPEMGRPQAIINKQLQIDKTDVFIGIIWRRFGTPSGENNILGIPYESGTQEEFETVYRLWQQNKKPEIMFFRSVKSGSLKNVDAIQLGKVNSFFDNFSHDKDHPGLYKEYASTSEFEKSVRMSLFRYAISQTPQASNNAIVADFSPRIQKHGFLNLYLPEWNDERNAAKQNSIKNSRALSLIAHSGFSFMAQFGHRHRHIIEDLLAQGGTFNAILTNPWTQSGFYIALSEYSPDNYSKYTYKRNGMKYIDPLRIIQNSRWYQVKYTDSINGYHILKEKYGDQIQLRFTDVDIPASILITDSDCYIEPYLSINRHLRHVQGMMTFEVRVSDTSKQYQHNRNYFDFLWDISIGLDEYMASIEQSKKQLKHQVHLSWEE